MSMLPYDRYFMSRYFLFHNYIYVLPTYRFIRLFFPFKSVCVFLCKHILMYLLHLIRYQCLSSAYDEHLPYTCFSVFPP